MSTSPRDLLQLAVELARSPLPVRRRAAISRAYYAVFHGACEIFLTLGVRVGNGPSAHGDVRALLYGFT